VAAPKLAQLVRLVREDPGITVATASSALAVDEHDVVRYLARLIGKVVNQDGRLYPFGQQPAVDSSGHITTYVIVDTETTGVDPSTAELLEIAAIKVTEDGEEEFRRYVRFDGTIPVAVERITGITRAKLDAEGVELREALVAFLEFAADLPWVGHNLIRYDEPLLRRLLQRESLPTSEAQLLDTMYLAHAALWREPPSSFRLDYLAATLLGGRPEDAHSALVDVRTTRKLIAYCIEKLQGAPPEVTTILRALVREMRFVADPID